ncbi:MULTISPECIES: hypothetical protein [unclassified Staphylococcus]|uniref:hypothetical protein n=1 Tax=unclassified Staphylococcus TaxID=91994 RepID=UPI00194F1C58|nr:MULTISPECIES: hypothetical protein [unclassified Staphylococcus]
MAYEYEIEIPMRLEDGRWLNMNVDDEVLDELEEVYRKAKAFDEIKKRFEKEYKAEVLEESLYYPENFDNSEFLVDVEHILYFEDVRYVKIKEDK